MSIGQISNYNLMEYVLLMDTYQTCIKFIPPVVYLMSPGVIEEGGVGRWSRQVLDHLPVERERGITVKAQTASMVCQHSGHHYLLNLIDTPVRSLPNQQLACLKYAFNTLSASRSFPLIDICTYLHVNER